MGSRFLPIADDELQRLEECLLIGYSLDATPGTFELTCDHLEKPAQGERAFLKLIFHGTERFEREAGLNASLQRYTTEYRARGAPPTVFQAVKIAPDGARKRATFWFGPAYGGCSFSYEALRAFVKVARSRQRGDEWKYRDVESNEAVDFYEPFGRYVEQG